MKTPYLDPQEPGPEPEDYVRALQAKLAAAEAELGCLGDVRHAKAMAARGWKFDEKMLMRAIQKTRDERDAARQALTLYRSMVQGGEDESETSKAAYMDGMGITQVKQDD